MFNSMQFSLTKVLQKEEGCASQELKINVGQNSHDNTSLKADEIDIDSDNSSQNSVEEIIAEQALKIE